MRVADYQDVGQSIIDTTTQSISYLLGALFLVAAAIPAVGLMLSIYDRKFAVWRELVFITTFLFTLSNLIFGSLIDGW